MADQPESGFYGIVGSNLGASLRELLLHDDLKPGDSVSYELAKAVFLYHPLGSKMAEAPIALAQSQEREIAVDSPGPKDILVKAFTDEWKKLEASRTILNICTQARVYGLASMGLGTEGSDNTEPVELGDLYKQKVFFNVWDPLNTSGMIVDQDPNSPSFQKHGDIRVGGKRWHRSRTRTLMNEESIYIAWTDTAFSYAGRSVYQRALYPLKSFVWSMVTDEMVVRKAGVLVAKLEQPGSIVDRVWKAMAGVKRALLREAKTDNVLSIGIEESIETLNMQNVDGAYGMARDNVIKNIAVAAGMPAKMLTQEAFVEGFGEGTEDAKNVAAYIDRVRVWMQPAYTWMDTVCMYRAWNPEFYETVQVLFPESKKEGGYGDVPYEEAFYEWKNGFSATWPNLLREPESELAQADDVKLKAAIALAQVLVPEVDPENKGNVMQFVVDLVNMRQHLFEGAKLELDIDALKDYLVEQKDQQDQLAAQGGPGGLAEQERSEKPAVPFSSHDRAATKVISWR